MSRPLQLTYKVHRPSPIVPEAASNLYILHGMLGNANNWGTTARQLLRHPSLKDTMRGIYAFDMRNHGESPHHPDHSTAALASDIEGLIFAGQRDLLQHPPPHYPHTHGHDGPRSVVMGHSMGGIALMETLLRRYNEEALLPEHPTGRTFGVWDPAARAHCVACMRGANTEEGISETQPLREVLYADGGRTPAPVGAVDRGRIPTLGRIGAAVVVDITPTARQPAAPAAATGPGAMLRAMARVDLRAIHSYDDSRAALMRAGVTDKGLCDFISTNIAFHEDRSQGAYWKCNLEALLQGYRGTQPDIMDWFSGYDKDGKGLKPQPCTLPTLFVFGSESPYNDTEQRSRIKQLFPNSTQVVVEGAGHLVHTDKTKEFVEVVAPFIADHMQVGV